MSLFLGEMHHHIPGRKGLTEKKDIISLMPEKEVYIPLAAGANTDFEIFVSEGDKVQIDTKLAQTKSGFFVPLYSSVSGTYMGIKKRMSAMLKPMDHMVIALDEAQTKTQALMPLDYHTATREECVEQIKQAGIVGLGGAGFPTYVKYQKPDGIDCIIINAVECEPYITADYKIIMKDVSHFVMGCEIFKKMADVSKVYIAIKKTHPDLIQVVQDALHDKQGMEVYPVPDVYPMGWERVLVREILHTEYDRLPSEAHTIISNATTAIAAAYAFEKGEPITRKIVTVSGEGVKNPSNVECPVGTPVQEVIKACGGYTSESVRLIAGGPMMGRTIVNDQFVIDRATNAITVLPNVADDAIVCLRCGRCSDHCPAGLQPVRIAMAVNAGDAKEMEKRGALQCIECGLCTCVCPSHIDVTENVRKAKRTVMLKKKK